VARQDEKGRDAAQVAVEMANLLSELGQPMSKQAQRRATRSARPADKSARTRAREFALQALYQHLVGRNPAATSTCSPAT
jgi:hypothetical protein